VTAIAGLVQSIVGGQPLLIIGVAEPIVVVWGFMYQMVKDDADLGLSVFLPFCSYVCVWTGVICMVVAMLGATRLIVYFTLFAGELFGGLIAILFMQQAVHGTVEEFHKTSNGTVNGLWATLTVLGLPVSIFYFQKLRHTRLLSPFWRGAADYSPVIMVLAWTVLSLLLPAYDLDGLPQRVNPQQPWEVSTWSVTKTMADLPMKGVLMALGPAIVISVLFFFDHTVSSQLAQTGDDVRVERPDAYAWDLLLLGLLTVLAGLLGLPPINGVIPQAPMHSRALRGIKLRQKNELATAEEGTDPHMAARAPAVTRNEAGQAAAVRFASADRDGDGKLTRTEWIAMHGNADGFAAFDVDGDGTVTAQEFQQGELDVMEQRGSNMMQAVLVGICALCAPAVQQIPTSVLWGYFAFMALESVPDMQMSNRIVLLFIEESAREDHLQGKPYADVPNSLVTQFTILQVILLVAIWALIVFGGIAGIAFPIPILLLLPLRSHCLPWWFGADNIRMLDEAVYENADQDHISATVTPAPAPETPGEEDPVQLPSQK